MRRRGGGSEAGASLEHGRDEGLERRERWRPREQPGSGRTSSSSSGSSVGSSGRGPAAGRRSRPALGTERGEPTQVAGGARRLVAAPSASSRWALSSGRWRRGARNGRRGRPPPRRPAMSSRLVRVRIGCEAASRGQLSSTRPSGPHPQRHRGRGSTRPTAPSRAPMAFGNRSTLCSTSRTARATTGPGHRKLVTRSCREGPAGASPARGRDGHRPAASRRWTGRRRRRGTGDGPVQTAGWRDRAVSGRHPGPHRRAGAGTPGASGRGASHRPPAPPGSRATRSSKSSRPSRRSGVS